MRQENIDFLEKNRLCHKEVQGDPFYGRSCQLAVPIEGELLTIMRAEFQPGYPYEGGCGSCLFNLVNALYAKFDEYLATKPIVVAATFPKQEPTIIDPEYQEYLNWKKFKEGKSNGVKIPIIETIEEFGTISEDGKTMQLQPFQPKIKIRNETPAERAIRLADPNRVIKRRAKRK